MSRLRRTYFPISSLLTRYLLLVTSFFLLTSCTLALTPIPLSSESNLYVFNLSTSSLIGYSSDFTIQRELPLNLPCPLIATHPAPNQPRLALELDCTSGPLVQILDTTTGNVTIPFPDGDSHFLAWDFEGNIYLRIDALGNARLMRVAYNMDSLQFDLPVQTYDMDFAPGGGTLVYSFTRGLRLGSELWAANSSGRRTWQLHADSDSIITFARWSPNGKYIAFIKLPDSETPFPLGELWLMDADGKNPHPLARADAGHGYAPAWSPDSTRLAFVGRDNPKDPRADQDAGALVSNIYIFEVASAEVTRVTHFEGSIVESPVWSANGHFLAFSVVTLNDTINIWFADPVSGAVTRLESRGPTSCPIWVRMNDLSPEN